LDESVASAASYRPQALAQAVEDLLPVAEDEHGERPEVAARAELVGRASMR
jgi:hypothetical protein